MKVNITYPVQPKWKLQRNEIISRAKWPFLFTAYICPIINLFVGGRAWSVIVLWSLWILWSFAFAPALVEYNRISQFIKLIARGCVLLILIDALLAPGWAVEVVSIVCFGGLIVSGVLFFTDLERQKQNMMPMLFLAAVSLVCSVTGLIIFKKESSWALVVMGAISLALLTSCFGILKGEFVRGLRKHFHR